jgi:hypothetical protein
MWFHGTTAAAPGISIRVLTPKFSDSLDDVVKTIPISIIVVPVTSGWAVNGPTSAAPAT